MKYVRCNVPSADLHVFALCHQAMFSLCMVESEADEVTLQGVTSVGLKHALDFAYTGQVSLSHREHNNNNICRDGNAVDRKSHEKQSLYTTQKFLD